MSIPNGSDLGEKGPVFADPNQFHSMSSMIASFHDCARAFPTITCQSPSDAEDTYGAESYDLGLVRRVTITFKDGLNYRTVFISPHTPRDRLSHPDRQDFQLPHSFFAPTPTIEEDDDRARQMQNYAFSRHYHPGDTQSGVNAMLTQFEASYQHSDAYSNPGMIAALRFPPVATFRLDGTRITLAVRRSFWNYNVGYSLCLKISAIACSAGRQPTLSQNSNNAFEWDPNHIQVGQAAPAGTYAEPAYYSNNLGLGRALAFPVPLSDAGRGFFRGVVGPHSGVSSAHSAVRRRSSDAQVQASHGQAPASGGGPRHNTAPRSHEPQGPNGALVCNKCGMARRRQAEKLAAQRLLGKY
ncbi:hypothetical protein FB45DRAFT_877356 [Roridomyces roridus]|uniref:Uncharacterized protein n=1 Tax=Roridomyces roridus TaxID=1738132 RepID=A0AAD7F866_9AGAR|nr:hypothetical protein FB45DRAFT_877356 [Roridomyces roridus]